MKRVWFAFLSILCIFLYSHASAEYTAYVFNPDPACRLNLRTDSTSESDSLGKYFNGTRVTVLSHTPSGWADVIIGSGKGALYGYMHLDYLSSQKVPDARPEYASTMSFVLYSQPSWYSEQQIFQAGPTLSMMGYDSTWRHVVVELEDGTQVTGFVPRSSTALQRIHPPSEEIHVYISNPDPADRLHLRAEPTKYSESLGKYYNGTVGTLEGFSEDEKWVKVNLYGRTGYMSRNYVTLDGEVNHTQYAIPTVHVRGHRPVIHNGYPVASRRIRLSSNAAVEVLGLINRSWLHVRYNGETGYMLWSDTDFVDP